MYGSGGDEGEMMTYGGGQDMEMSRARVDDLGVRLEQAGFAAIRRQAERLSAIGARLEASRPPLEKREPGDKGAQGPRPAALRRGLPGGSSAHPRSHPQPGMPWTNLKAVALPDR